MAAEQSGRRFGFENTTFIAAVENPEASYNAMAAEILKSTEQNPLFIIAAGPMHVVGTGFERAKAKNPEALKYVTIVSHSVWNNRHSDNPALKKTYHSEPEEPHTGWTWDEMKREFGGLANFVQISDQNGTGTGSEVYKTKDKFNFGVWSKIDWIKDHKDPNMRWLYQVAKSNPCGPDFSDAGLAYYLVADLDGVRGDDQGNDIKLHKWMGDKPFTNIAKGAPLRVEQGGAVVIGEDYIVIEAESTLSPLGKWVVRREGDPLYDKIGGYPKPLGGAYIEYTGGSLASRPLANVEEDVLVYKFTPMSSGNYIFTARMAQRITVNGVAEPKHDYCNDIFVKMEGEFKSGNATEERHLREWTKFYGMGVDKWGALSRGDVEHKKFVYSYALEAGKEYTFKISGRSQRCILDYLIFVKSPYKYANHMDIAVANPIKYRPGAEHLWSNNFTMTIPSINFDRYTNMGEGFVNATVDKWRKVLQVADRDGVGAAEYRYDGPTCEADIVLNTMLESDGEPKYKLFIGGKLIGEVQNSSIHGTKVKDYTAESHNIGSTTINNGDTIRVEFTNATNGKVPEGDLTATARGRWSSIVLKSK